MDLILNDNGGIILGSFFVRLKNRIIGTMGGKIGSLQVFIFPSLNTRWKTMRTE